MDSQEMKDSVKRVLELSKSEVCDLNISEVISTLTDSINILQNIKQDSGDLKISEAIDKLTKPEPQFFKPVVDENYYYVEIIGAIYSCIYKGNLRDCRRLANFNCFKTYAEAAIHSKKLLALSRINNLIIEHNDGWIANWNDYNEKKCFIEYNHFNNIFKFNRCTSNRTLSQFYPCKDLDFLGQIIKNHGDDLRLIFGIEEVKDEQ